jgi:hypothetical protein
VADSNDERVGFLAFFLGYSCPSFCYFEGYLVGWFGDDVE